MPLIDICNKLLLFNNFDKLILTREDKRVQETFKLFKYQLLIGVMVHFPTCSLQITQQRLSVVVGVELILFGDN